MNRGKWISLIWMRLNYYPVYSNGSCFLIELSMWNYSTACVALIMTCNAVYWFVSYYCACKPVCMCCTELMVLTHKQFECNLSTLSLHLNSYHAHEKNLFFRLLSKKQVAWRRWDQCLFFSEQTWSTIPCLRQAADALSVLLLWAVKWQHGLSLNAEVIQLWSPLLCAWWLSVFVCKKTGFVCDGLFLFSKTLGSFQRLIYLFELKIISEKKWCKDLIHLNLHFS